MHLQNGQPNRKARANTIECRMEIQPNKQKWSLFFFSFVGKVCEHFQSITSESIEFQFYYGPKWQMCLLAAGSFFVCVHFPGWWNCSWCSFCWRMKLMGWMWFWIGLNWYWDGWVATRWAGSDGDLSDLIHHNNFGFHFHLTIQLNNQLLQFPGALSSGHIFPTHSPSRPTDKPRGDSSFNLLAPKRANDKCFRRSERKPSLLCETLPKTFHFRLQLSSNYV